MDIHNSKKKMENIPNVLARTLPENRELILKFRNHTNHADTIRRSRSFDPREVRPRGLANFLGKLSPSPQIAFYILNEEERFLFPNRKLFGPFLPLFFEQKLFGIVPSLFLFVLFVHRLSYIFSFYNLLHKLCIFYDILYYKSLYQVYQIYIKYISNIYLMLYTWIPRPLQSSKYF